jgi:adenosylcobinamide-phosphate guanylyltransferase
MYALIMAGGSGSRLGLGEKPLILIGGKPMISYVIDAFSAAGFEPVVAVSPSTPMTINWCRAHGVTVCKADGAGYIEDMVSVVRIIDERHPLFISVADIPCITPEIIRTIAEAYSSSGKDGCSTWIAEGLVSSCRGGMPYRKTVDGTEACPAGINILRGDLIDQPQDELQLLLHEPGLALNVNTRADRARAEDFLKHTSCNNPSRSER